MNTPNSLREKLNLGRSSEIPDQKDELDEEVDAGKCFSCERGSGRNSTMLDLRMLDGSHFAFAYHGIGPLEFDRTKIWFDVTMPTGDVYKVRIEGRNLPPLFDALRRHRCSWVQQSEAIADLAAKDATVVHSIEIRSVDASLSS